MTDNKDKRFNVIVLGDGSKHINREGKKYTLCGIRLLPGEEKNLARNFTLSECPICTGRLHRLMSK